jgi:hypothetical protein
MINWKRVKSDKLYKVYWLDPITRIQEKLNTPFGKQCTKGSIIVGDTKIWVIHNDPYDDDDNIEDEREFTIIHKDIIYKIEEFS